MARIEVQALRNFPERYLSRVELSFLHPGTNQPTTKSRQEASCVPRLVTDTFTTLGFELDAGRTYIGFIVSALGDCQTEQACLQTIPSPPT